MRVGETTETHTQRKRKGGWFDCLSVDDVMLFSSDREKGTLQQRLGYMGQKSVGLLNHPTNRFHPLFIPPTVTKSLKKPTALN